MPNDQKALPTNPEIPTTTQNVHIRLISNNALVSFESSKGNVLLHDRVGDYSEAIIVEDPLMIKLDKDKDSDSDSDNDDDNEGRSSVWQYFKSLSNMAELDANPHLPLLGSQKNLAEEIPVCYKRFRGIFAMLVATLLGALSPQILYYIQNILHLGYSHSLFMFWFYVAYVIFNSIPLAFRFYFYYEDVVGPLRENPKMGIILCLRGAIGCLVMYIGWYAIDYMGSPAPVAVIISMAPILVYVNAFFVLHEALGVIPIINAIIACGGVLVMNLDQLKGFKKGGGEDQNQDDSKSQHIWAGTGLALLSMACVSWVITIVRLLKGVDYMLINMSFGVFGVVIMGAVVCFSGTFTFFKESNTIWLCIATAVIITISNLLFSYALKHEQAGIASLVKTSEIIFNYMFQYFLFGLKPTILAAIGSAMILLGVLCVALRKIVLESEETSRIRRYLFFLKY